MSYATDSRLKAFRLNRGLTQKALADGSGINIRQIQKMESGEYALENITLKNAIALADFLEVDPHELLGKEKKMLYNYFCGNCGHHFSNNTPYYSVAGILPNGNEIWCPECGTYEIYQDNHEGAAQSVEVMTKYENEQKKWEE